MCRGLTSKAVRSLISSIAARTGLSLLVYFRDIRAQRHTFIYLKRRVFLAHGREASKKERKIH